MKTFFSFLFIFAVLLGGWYFYQSNQSFHDSVYNIAYVSPCDQPIHYRIGTIDPQFGISTSAFTADTSQAASLWGTVENKQLFIYDPHGELSVNLIYDSRQALDTQINHLQNTLQQGKSTLDTQMSQYENEAAAFRQKLQNLNDEIGSWNAKGGAPPDVYDKLKQEQKNLQQEADHLNGLAHSLNLTTDNYNAQVNSLNQTVSQFNTALQLKPEEGLYDPQTGRITVYFDNSRQELIHTLAHELGHARGLDHNTDSASIMYPYTTQYISPSADDVAAMHTVCQKQFVGKIWLEEIRTYVQQIVRKYRKA